MPNKKYLGEMQPIIILIRLLKEGESESKYIKCQLNLSQDIWDVKDPLNANEMPLKTARAQDLPIDFSSFKDPNDKWNTPSREKRTVSGESLELKSDWKTKDILLKEISPSKENSETKTKETAFSDESISKNKTELQISFENEESSEEFKNLKTVMHVIFQDSLHLFRKTQSSKIISILIKSQELATFLESNESEIRGCRIWEWAYKSEVLDHINMKSHKKVRDELGISEQEDIQLSPIILKSSPGSIEDELQKLKESSMKVKYKKLKQQMINKWVSHEIAASTGKDITTASNKKKMQILSMELENKVMPTISDYAQLESKLNSLIAILVRKRQEELHLLRKLKIIPWVAEIWKKISVCPRNEIKDLVRSIELAMQILFIFVSIRENKDYMLSTNRILLLTDLLIWTLNKPMPLFFASTYVPQLLEIITIWIKHRCSYENQQMKSMLIEWILWSPIINKLKLKFDAVTGPLQLTGALSLTPAILCKGLSFYESITSIVNVDFRYRPVYEKSNKISSNVYFLISKTKMLGVIPLVVDVLFEKASEPKEMLPNSILNLVYISLKLINNMFRIDLNLCQQILSEVPLQDQFLHMLSYTIKYCQFFDKEEVQDILYETILMIGYYTLFNKIGQEKIRSGAHSLLLKLWQLDITFFMEKQKKEILFPTLISLSYKDSSNLDIIDNEMDKDYLKKYLVKNSARDDLHNIPEDELERSIDSSMKSYSISSTNSSSTSITTNLRVEHCPFVHFSNRFPRNLLCDALEFYSE